MRVAFEPMESQTMNSQVQIADICDQIKELLLSKNLKYGNSALEPCRIFSSASTVEQLLVRIDDKLSRIKRGAGLLAKDEDVINDLIGYLVLLKIALNSIDEPDYVPSTTSNGDVLIFSGTKDSGKEKELWNGGDVEPYYQIGSYNANMPAYFDLARKGLAD